MNSPLKLEEDFLSCGICFEVFKQPKILTCLHTFCYHCLSSYITTTTLLDTRSAFSCPTCREKVAPPNPEQNDWANQFRNNFYINNLIDANYKGTQCSDSPSDAKKCQSHHNALDLFCVDCNKIVCVQCSIISHRSCRQIIPCHKIAQEKRSQLVAYHSRLRKHISKIEQATSELEIEKEKVLSQQDVLRTKIQKRSEEMMQLIADEAAVCLSKVACENTKCQLTLEKEIASKRSLLKTTETLCDKMKDVMMSPDSYIFDEMDSILSRRANLLKEIPSSYDIPIFQISFAENSSWNASGLLGKLEKRVGCRTVVIQEKPVRALLDEIAQVSLIPGVSNLTDEPTLPSPPPSPFFDTTKNLAMISEQNAKTKGDKSKPCLRDITIVSGNVIVVTDYANSRLKSFFRHDKCMNDSHVGFPTPPHAICIVGGNQVAVTLPKSKQIALVSVNPNLILEKMIQTNKKYWGVTWVGKNSLAASTCPGSEPGVIDIIGLNGELLKTVISSSERYLSNPLYIIWVASGDIIVSDCTSNRVFKIRQNGTILSRESCMRPMGMTCDIFDAILVVSENNTIFALNENGKIVAQFQLLSESMKSRKIRSIAFSNKLVYIITDLNYILTFQLV